MTSPLLNRVTPKDTIETWRQKTNEIVDRLKDLYPHVTNNLNVENDASIGGKLTVDGELHVKENLIVDGTVTTINSTELHIEDSTILLNSNLTGTPPNALQSGIEVNRGSSDNKKIYWDEETDKWNIEGPLNIEGNLNDISGHYFQWGLDSNTNHIYNLNTGNVGIGEGSPEARLHVKKTSAATKYVDTYSTMVIEDTEARLQLCASNAGTNAAAITLSNGANHWTMHHRGPSTTGYLAFGYANTTSTFDIVNSTMSNTPPLSIHTDGKVGIGTTSPGAKLDITENSGGTQFRVGGTSSTGGQFQINNAGSDIYALFRASGSNDNKILLHSNGDSYFVGGNVGIGETTPAEKLEVSGAIKLDTTTNNNVGTIRYNTTTNDFEGNTDGTSGGWTSLTTSPSTSPWTTSSNDIYYNNGKVGIGTSSPSARLHIVEPTNSTTAEIFLSSSDTSVTPENFIVNKLSFHQTDSSGGGAGTGVTGAIGMRSAKALNNSTFYGLSADMAFFVSGDSTAGNASDNASLEAMTIQRGTGNVGIGTTSPIYRLDVTGGRAIVRGTPETALVLDDSGVGDFGRPMQYISSDGGFLKIGNANRAGNNATTNSVDRMVISNVGYVGIGVTNPLTKLHVDGTIRASNLTGGTVLVSNSSEDITSSSITTTELNQLTGINTNETIQDQLDDLSTDIGNIDTSKWTGIATGIYRNSNVGIGNFSSNSIDESLHIRGTGQTNYNIKISGDSSVASNEVGLILEKTHNNLYDYKVSNYNDTFYFNYRQNTGDAWTVFYGYVQSASTHAFIGNISANGTIQSTSDITLKENLEIIENPIEKIKEINGYTYNMIGKEDRHAGLIAQEVEKVLPEVVSENSDGIKSLAYGNIVALLVETVKEQQKQIDELKKLISDK